MTLLTGKTVLITGATGGFGERLARAFNEAGATLLLHGRSEDSLQELKAKLLHQDRCELLSYDMRQISFLPALQQKTEIMGGMDIVINNAAEQGPIGKTWEIDPAAWSQTIEVDLLLPVAICQLAVPQMIRSGGGKIINISGGGATGSRPLYCAYACAKTALVRFTECLADETRDHKIDVNAIAPGIMQTKMHPTRTASMPEDPFAEPVALCLYLASQQSDGISGKLISAVWDDWRNLHAAPITPDLYTLRRIAPPDKEG